MKYQKPEIEVVVPALEAVQAMDKELGMPHDNSEVYRTVSAYHADE
jgi:hypothetical protein